MTNPRYKLGATTDYKLYRDLSDSNKTKLTINVSNGKKKVMKIKMRKATKRFIELSNKYECLDELVEFPEIGNDILVRFISEKEYKYSIVIINYVSDINSTSQTTAALGMILF